MSFLSNVRRVSALASQGAGAPVGDIAILKMDAVGMQASPRHRAALAALDGYAPTIDLDVLAALPDGTYGREVARFMRDNGLMPFTFSDDIDAQMRARNTFGIRLASTHDLVHVLCGFDTSWPGEMGVYAVQYAQGWSRWSTVLALATWLVYPWLTGFRLGALRAAWRRGVALGERAPMLLGVRLEDHFDEPLRQVRASLGLPADALVAEGA